MRSREQSPLDLRQAPADFNDVVLRSVVHLGMHITEVVEYILCKRSVARTNLVYDEVLVREVLKQVLSHETLRDGLAIPRLGRAVSFR